MIIKSTYDPHTLAMKRLRGKIMYKYYTVESQVQAMRAYTTSLNEMYSELSEKFSIDDFFYINYNVIVIK